MAVERGRLGTEDIPPDVAITGNSLEVDVEPTSRELPDTRMPAEPAGAPVVAKGH